MMNSAEQFAVTAHKVRSGVGALQHPATIRGRFAGLMDQSKHGPSSPCWTLSHYWCSQKIKHLTLSSGPSLLVGDNALFLSPSFTLFCSFLPRPSLCHLSVLPVCMQNCTLFNEAVSIMTSKCYIGVLWVHLVMMHSAAIAVKCAGLWCWYTSDEWRHIHWDVSHGCVQQENANEQSVLLAMHLF